MNGTPTTYGIPDTLPPLRLQDVWGRLWLGVAGLLLITFTLVPRLAPPPWNAILILACWLAPPAYGMLNHFARRATRSHHRAAANGRVTLYTALMVSFGLGFTVWARHLHLPWPVVLGILFLIEGLTSLIVSLTEWWRLSTAGFSVALMACGFGFPLASGQAVWVLLGTAIVAGSLTSAGILCWQLRRCAKPDGQSRAA